MSPRSFSVVAGLCALASTSSAHADVPTCNGANEGEARRYMAEGKQHYRHALAQATVDADEMRAALADFDAACAVGEGMSLEPRAYALSALQRYVEAAESLDAFLKAHPLDSLPKDVRDRVTSQRPAILANVATLRIVSDAHNAQVVVGGKAVGTAPIEMRVAAHTPVEIDVTAAGFAPIHRSVTLEGEMREESFAMRPAQGGELLSEPVAVAPPAEAPAGRGLMKWVYVSAGGAVVFLGAGVGFSVWRSNRTSTYDASCLGSTPVPGCDATLSEFHAAEASQIAAFALGGALAATAVVLWFVDRKAPSTAAAPAASGLSFDCAPGLGIVCSGRF